jgi:hypothetical protein
MPWFRVFMEFRALGTSRLKMIWGETMIVFEGESMGASGLAT